MLTYGGDVGVVVPFVAVPVHDARLAHIRVAEHEDFVGACELERHVGLTPIDPYMSHPRERLSDVA